MLTTELVLDLGVLQRLEVTCPECKTVVLLDISSSDAPALCPVKDCSGKVPWMELSKFRRYLQELADAPVKLRIAVRISPEHGLSVTERP